MCVCVSACELECEFECECECKCECVYAWFQPLQPHISTVAFCLTSVLVIRRVHSLYSVFARPMGLYEATSVSGPFSL